MGGRALQKLGGRSFPPKFLKLKSHTKTNDIAPTMAATAAVALRKPSGAFRGNYAHDITPIESSFHLLLVYAPRIFLMSLVLCG